MTRGSASSSSRNERLFVPRAAGVLLHDAIRLVAGEPGLHQAQQHRLAEHQTVAGTEVGEHALGEHLQALQQAVHAAHHVVGEHGAVGQHDALDRAVRDVALVPQRHVLHAGLQVAAQHACRAR